MGSQYIFEHSYTMHLYKHIASEQRLDSRPSLWVRTEAVINNIIQLLHKSELLLEVPIVVPKGYLKRVQQPSQGLFPFHRLA